LHATLTVRMVLNRNLSILVIKIYEPLDVERKNRSEMNLAVLMVRGILPTEVVGNIDCVQLPGQTSPLQYEAPLELASYGRGDKPARL
jgi:hypothetical protein